MYQTNPKIWSGIFDKYNHTNASFSHDYNAKIRNSELMLCVIELLKF